MWNVIHPYDELLNILNNKGHVEYFDHEYSPLIDKVSNLCNKILNVFEQSEFSSEHGKMKRNELNGSDEIFNRIFSFGIKSKHGSVASSYYIDVNLQLPVSIYYDRKNNSYSYRYTPLLNNNDFIDDFNYVIMKIIELYSLRISFKNLNKEDIKYEIKTDNTIYVKLSDTFNYYGNGMTESISLRTLELINTDWVLTDLDKYIDINLEALK